MIGVNILKTTNTMQQQKQKKQLSFGMKPETGYEIIRGIFQHGVNPRLSELVPHNSSTRKDFCKRVVEYFNNPGHNCGKPLCLFESTKMLVGQLKESMDELMPRKNPSTNLKKAVDQVADHVSKITDFVIGTKTGQLPDLHFIHDMPGKPTNIHLLVLEEKILNSLKVIKDKPDPLSVNPFIRK